MYVVIVGASKVGVSLARWLLSGGHEVAIIDRDPAKCAEAEEELGSVSVVGDGTEAGVLAKAGTNRADLLIAATGADDINLVACQMANYRFSVRQTVALVNEPSNERLFALLGTNVTANKTNLIVTDIQQSIGDLVPEEIRELE